MMNRKSILLLASATALAGSTLAFVGCQREPEAPPVVYKPPPPPPAPEAPPVTPISDLMAQLRIDDRISMLEENAPDTDEARTAVLEFFDAFARGDSRALSARLLETDKLELQAMVESGVWQETTGNIQRITIKETGMSPGGECALAIFEVAPPGQLPAYQPQLWYYSPSPEDATQYEFAPAATPPNMMSRLSGTDWIKAWHDILDEELELASRLDTTINLPQRNLEETTEEGGGTSPSAPSAPSGPLGPKTPGGPEAPPRRPPGIPSPGG